IPLYKSSFYERPTPEKMIAALEIARRQLGDHAYSGICIALPSDPTGCYLAEYISCCLENHSWLTDWRGRRGLLIDRKSMYEARLAWI
ncbi:hypothetical protein NL298_26960, partial [Klebsiella pneumoniae]|nr:hypothetical protein [Klebsiella pneumoniae]